MTENDWNTATDPQEMLSFLQKSGKGSERKFRLFAVACVRRVWRLCPPEAGGGNAVQVSERFADQLADRADLKAARRHARSCEFAATRLDAHGAAMDAASAAAYKVRLLTIDYQGRDHVAAGYTADNAAVRLSSEQFQGQAVLLRDIFGPLAFRPSYTVDPTWLSWNDGTIPMLAETAYQLRLMPSGELDQDRLAVLADALEEVGADAFLLEHLRSPVAHVRGCFVIDLLTGRK